MKTFAFRATLKRKFIAGLVVTVPAVFTIMAVVWFFRFVDGILGILYDKILGYHVIGFGFVSAVALIFFIGIISTNLIGKRVIKFFEHAIVHIPVFKGIYTAIKQLVDAFGPDSKSSFKNFVIVEYPRKDVFAFGFLTKECMLKESGSNKEHSLRAVYIPTNNLYLGEVVLMKEEDIFYTDIPIENGIKIILSGGISAPSVISGAKK
jgi:uncharacterized membrane protein